MKSVFIVCGKQTKESYAFWVSAVFTSKRKAENWVKILNETNGGYHYYFEEPICKF